MGKNKRMFYLKEDNVEFYDSLENKSDFINGALQTARLGGVTDLKVTEVGEEQTTSSRPGLSEQEAIQSMRDRDAKRLKEYRERNGLYDPVKEPRE